MKEQESLKIKEIAKLAGVSVATVSRVINQNGRFSPDTEARVRKVIEESGYVPNSMAKGLRTSRSNAVGVIVPDLLNPHFSGLVLELEKILFEHAFSTVICNAGESNQLEKKHLDTLIAQKVSGIVMISAHTALPAISGIPVVYLDRRPEAYDEQSNTILIESDNATGGYLAAKKLLDSGCKSIAVVMSKGQDFNQKARLNGVKMAWREAGCSSNRLEMIALDEVSTIAARDKIREMLSGRPKPEGFLCMTDTLALGVMTGLIEQGVKIPDEVVVTGFDDAPLAEFFQPPLTTIHQNTRQLALTAAQAMLAMIQGQLPEKKHVVIPVELVTRRSTRN